ncbi:MAG: AEC family transporter [Pseudomonadota bacterium]
MLTTLINVIAPVFLIVALGYGWVRAGRGFDRQMAGEVVTYLGAPCLVFSQLSVITLPEGTIGGLAGAAAVSVVTAGLVGSQILRVTGLDWRAFTPSLMIANTGNMGLPVAFLAFGQEGLAFALVYFLTTLIINVSVTSLIIGHGETLRQQLVLPAIYLPAALGALAFSLSGAAPPAVLLNTTTILGGLAIPLMLLTLGATIAALPLQKPGVSLGLAGMRFGLGLGGGLLGCALFGLVGTQMAVVLLQSTMPVAVINFLFAHKFNRSPEGVASLIVVSTLLGLITIPAVLVFV